MNDPEKPAQQPAPASAETETIPVVDARQLFRGAREVWIEHDGERYRLRLTRRNKLILQK